MQTGRQTRRKSYPQSASSEPNSESKEPEVEKKKVKEEEPSSISPEKRVPKKSQNTKAKKNQAQVSPESVPTEPSSSEIKLPPSKIKEEPLEKSTDDPPSNSGQKSREKTTVVSNSEDLSEETRKQIEMLFEIAQASASKEDYVQAINFYHKILKLNDKSAPAWIALGHCYSMIGENRMALAKYQQALSISPESQKDEQLWYGIGLSFMKIEDWNNAEIIFRSALQLNPNPALKGEILCHLGTILKTVGNPKEAAKLLVESIVIGSFSIPKIVEILSLVGQAQEEADEIHEAIKSYKQALKLDETNLRALQSVGWLSFQIEQISQALEYLTKADLIDEDNMNILYMKGRCYLKIKQYNKAYECFHRCITKEPKNSTFWSSLGILFAEMEQVESAHECFSKALHCNPTNAENYFNMGCLYELCSQFEDALAMHTKAIELQPDFQLAIARKLGIFTHAQKKEKQLLEVQFKHHKFSPNLNAGQQKKISKFSPNQSEMNSLSLNGKSKTNHVGSQNMEMLETARNKSQALYSLYSQGNEKPGGLFANLESSQVGFGKNELSNILSGNSSLYSTSDLTNASSTNQFESQKLKQKGRKKEEEDVPLVSNFQTSVFQLKEQVGNTISPEINKGENFKGFLSKREEGAKPTKNIAQSIVLKHNYQGFQPKNSEGLGKASKLQPKSSLKLTHKLENQEDDEPLPQKKVKLESSGSESNGSQHRRK